MNEKISTLIVVALLVLSSSFLLSGCGGGGGGGGDDPVAPSPSGPYLLFYGDNSGTDASGDGLFKLQDGALWLLAIINSSGKSQAQDFTPFGEKYIFSACGALGCEPWITDGTIAGTTLLANLNLISDSNPQEYTLFDGAIYFSANDGVHGAELWRTDGTEVGTVMVKNIGIEDASLLIPPLIHGDPHNLTVFGDHLYFVANDVDYQGYGTGVELWRTDGTEAGTTIVKNIAIEDPDNLPNDPDTPVDSSPNQLTIFNGALYFVATDGQYGPDNYGVELWKSDGTEANTTIVKDIGINPLSALLPYDALPEQLTAFNGELYFFADDGLTGFEPWKTDGSELNTVQVANVGIDSADPFPTATNNLTYWTEMRGWLFFAADDGTSGVELWRTNGLSTAMVFDINPLAGGSVVPGRDDVFSVFNGQLLFFANDGTHGFEPWFSDGTLLGTRLLADIYSVPINTPSTADELAFLTEFQGRLYFTANDGFTGREFWSTDGTTVGTRVLKDIGPGYESGYSDAFGPSIIDGELFFSAFDGAINLGHGVEMWRTLGDESDTLLVEDLNPGAQNDGVLKAVPLLLP